MRETGLQETIIMMSSAQAGECGGAGKVAKFTPRASGALIDGATKANSFLFVLQSNVKGMEVFNSATSCSAMYLLVCGKEASVLSSSLYLAT
jgi:hypothetical protein